MASSVHSAVGFLRSLLVRQRAEESGDRDLLQRFLTTGDGDAFTLLVQRHGPRVLGVARRVVGQAHDAEDVFQATFLLLARQGQSLRRPEGLGSWLAHTAFRLALRVRKSRIRRADQETRCVPLPVRSPIDELTGRELLAVLDEELHRLPEKVRWPVVLCCLEGLSQEEAAGVLGCSAGAVRGRLERGRTRLRQRLTERGLALPAVLAASLMINPSVTAVPPPLRDATAQCLATGTASPGVAALVQGAMNMLILDKLKMIALSVLLIGVLSLGVTAWLQTGNAAPGEEPPNKPAAPEVPQAARTDLHGDPLPEGAVMRLGTLRQRAVSAKLAFSADGKTIVSVRGGRYVSIWDSSTGKRLQAKDLGNESWSEAYLSNDGRWLATRDNPSQGVYCIWDIESGKIKHKLEIKGVRFIMPITFSSDGQYVAAVGHARGKFVRVWRLDNGQEAFAKDIQTEGGSGLLSFTPDGGRLLASFGSADQGTYCWDLVSGKVLWQNKTFSPSSWVTTAEGKLVAADNRANALDLDSGQPAKVEKLPPFQWDNRLTTTPDQKTLLVSGAKGVTVWDLVAGKEKHVLKGAGEEMVVAPDGKSLLTHNGMMQRWDLETGKPLWPETWDLGHTWEVLAITISGDGQSLASASQDGSVRLWDLKTGKSLKVWTGHEARRPVRVLSSAQVGVTALAMSHDGRRLLSAGSEGRLRLFDTATGKELQSLDLPGHDAGELARAIYQIALNSDAAQGMALFGATMGTVAAGASPPEMTDKVALWDLQTGQLAALHRIPKMRSAGAVSPDARLVAANGNLIDVTSGMTLRSLEGLDKGGSREVGAFSRDGRLVIGNCSELIEKNGQRVLYPNGVRVWEAATGKTIGHFKKESWGGQGGFLPDNRFAATNDLTGLQVWDVRSGQLVLTRPMPEQVRSTATSGTYAGCFGFTPDGKRLATGHPDGTILVWDLNLPEDKPEPWVDKEADSLWADLKGEDASKAWHAIWRWTEKPDAALPLLRERLKPILSAKPEVTGPLIEDLDSDVFEKRQTAVRQLEELGPRAQPALQKALQANPSAEQKKHIEKMLEAVASPARKPSANELRDLRALAVLEAIRSPDTRRLLEDLAKGVEMAPLTQAARQALQRQP